MSLTDRVKGIIVSPAQEWNIVSSETPDTTKIITNYVLPLAGLAAIAAFVGYGLIGINAGGFFKIKGINWGIYHAISVLAGAIISIFLSAWIIDILAPNFGAEKNMARSVQLVAYSYTPVWVGGLLAIYPPLAIVGSLFGIYGLYLLYIGFPPLKKVLQEKHVSYFIVSLIVIILVYAIVGSVIMTRLVMPMMGLSFSSVLDNPIQFTP